MSLIHFNSLTGQRDKATKPAPVGHINILNHADKVKKG